MPVTEGSTEERPREGPGESEGLFQLEAGLSLPSLEHSGTPGVLWALVQP